MDFLLQTVQIGFQTVFFFLLMHFQEEQLVFLVDHMEVKV